MELHVGIKSQRLYVYEGNNLVHEYVISTGKAGVGFERGSGKTPVGNFVIGCKIGAGYSGNTIFKGREAVGEWDGKPSDRDMILGRIMWLEGMDEENKNTRERYIYIHGTNVEDLLGRPVSHGCIRLSRADVCSLFEMVSEGCVVKIEEGV